ncbi:hypothetical protein T492DRAFT_846896 [Pavlovales sp. CCMP2436]|nr:hypothetical protein T492DRAFT_846896 [Pavlovales sp. CCMP2436]
MGLTPGVAAVDMEVDPPKPAAIGGAGAWRTIMGKAKPLSPPQADPIGADEPCRPRHPLRVRLHPRPGDKKEFSLMTPELLNSIVSYQWCTPDSWRYFGLINMHPPAKFPQSRRLRARSQGPQASGGDCPRERRPQGRPVPDAQVTERGPHRRPLGLRLKPQESTQFYVFSRNALSRALSRELSCSVGCTRLGDGRVVARAVSPFRFSLRPPHFSLCYSHVPVAVVDKDALSQLTLGSGAFRCASGGKYGLAAKPTGWTLGDVRVTKEGPLARRPRGPPTT